MPRDVHAALADDSFTLLDWKRRIFGLYASIRADDDPAHAWRRWCAMRDELFAEHPQSPLDEERRRDFDGLDLYSYDPRCRVLGEVEPCERTPLAIATGGGETITFVRFAATRFALEGDECSLDLYWLEGYGGGLFLPFRDATSESETYGGGRYLLDTVKGSDLGESGGRLVLDFNFAYNPSCSYDARWVCPLAPPGSRIAGAVRAGERHPHRVRTSSGEG
ncbi:MAG TPA: DUF1684 domain-containing protein [Gaiellaceae bacterium]|nr:DUF1684 domain-containing protein [Gaiellaceae bacterium]